MTEMSNKRTRAGIRVSDLTTELLLSILNFLPFADTIRFGAVCSRWRSAVKEKGWRPAPQTPWLMVAGPVGDPHRTNEFFRLPFDSNRAFRIPPPVDDFYQRKIFGSSRGWLITLDRRGAIHMLNPVSGAQIQLPHITTISDTHPVNYIRKAIVAPFSFSAGVDGYTVVAITCNRLKLVVATPGDDKWTVLETPTDMAFYDIIYFKDMLYAVTLDGKTVLWDLTGPIHRIKEMLPDPGLRNDDLLIHGNNYLVEASGDLLMVISKVTMCTDAIKVIQMLKLDRATGGKWVRVTNLPKCSLFLGLNESMSFSSIDFPEVTENCIYFTEDCVGGPAEYDQYVTSDTGLYNLDDGSFKSYSCDSQNWPPPIWIIPNQ